MKMMGIMLLMEKDIGYAIFRVSRAIHHRWQRSNVKAMSYIHRLIFGDDTDAEPIWEIESDVKDKLTIDYVGNSVIVSTDDMSCANHTIKITLHADSFTSVTKEIQIKAFF